MMHSFRKPFPGIGLIASAIVSAILVAATVTAQNIPATPANPAAPVVSVDLDLLALLKSDEVFKEAIEGPVWHVKPGIGRKLVQIPVNIKPTDQPVDITADLVKLVGARFVCFRLNDPGDPDEGGMMDRIRRDNREFAAGSRRIAERLEVEGAQQGNNPFTPPAVSKGFKLYPDGRIEWKMDRFISPDSAVREVDNRFAMKLNRELLMRNRPERPTQTRATTREEIAQQREAAMQYQIKNQAFLSLQKQVNDLSVDIAGHLPGRVWVVFDMPIMRNDLAVDIAGTPVWTISILQLQTLREVAAIGGTTPQAQAQGQDNTRVLSPTEMAAVVRLSELASNTHIYTQRLTANVLKQSGMIPKVGFGDALFFLLRKLLEGDDAETRRIVMIELTRVIPQTRASAELLKLVAGKVADSSFKIDAFKGLLKVDLRENPNQAQEMVATANNMLRDESGPPPEDILKPLLNTARDFPDSVPVFVRNMQFHAMSDARRLDALVVVVENAGIEPVAAGWLNEKFLSTANPKELQTTLDVLAAADTGARDLGPAINSAVSFLFGKPPGAEQQQVRKARLRQKIPIDSTQHGIFRTLQHGDARIRNLAWQALSRFQLPDLPDETYSRSSGIADRYQVVLDAALYQVPTPTQVVDFLQDQPNKKRATEGLVQLVLRGSRSASVAAVRALVGGGGPLDEVMLELEAGERQGFAMLVYEVVTKRAPAPLVANVLRRRESNNPVAGWFGREVAAGNVPTPQSWITQFQTDDQLLDLVMSNDPELAKGAAAVLIAAAGGTDRMALAFIDKTHALTDQTKEAITAAWVEQRREIFARQLQAFEGNYRMVLRLYDGPSAMATDVAQQPTKEIVIGVIQLMVNVDSRSVSFGSQAMTLSIPDERHTISVMKPADIKTFPNEALAPLPFEKLTDPVPLRRRDDGSWLGSLQLDGGVRAELILLPADGSA